MIKYSQLSATEQATCRASFDFTPCLCNTSAISIIFSVSPVSITEYFFQLSIVSFLSGNGFSLFSSHYYCLLLKVFDVTHYIIILLYELFSMLVS